LLNPWRPGSEIGPVLSPCRRRCLFQKPQPARGLILALISPRGKCHVSVTGFPTTPPGVQVRRYLWQTGDYDEVLCRATRGLQLGGQPGNKTEESVLCCACSDQRCGKVHKYPSLAANSPARLQAEDLLKCERNATSTQQPGQRLAETHGTLYTHTTTCGRTGASATGPRVEDLSGRAPSDEELQHRMDTLEKRSEFSPVGSDLLSHFV
jgi:hypothetical protein